MPLSKLLHTKEKEKQPFADRVQHFIRRLFRYQNSHTTSEHNAVKKKPHPHLLHIAILEKNIPDLKLLLEQGLDPNEEYQGKTAVEIAIDNNFPEAVEILIQYGDIGVKINRKKILVWFIHKVRHAMFDNFWTEFRLQCTLLVPQCFYFSKKNNST